VGKTPVAAASALRATELGWEALVALRSLLDEAIRLQETRKGEAPSEIDIQ